MDIFAQFTPELKLIWNDAISREQRQVPFLSYHWHRHWHNSFGQNENLTIFTDRANHVLIPLAITGATAHFTGGEEIADYLDAVGGADQKADTWTQTLTILKERGVTSLNLRNIPANSPTLTFFRSFPSSVISQEDTTPIITLPASFDEYLLSLDRKDRHELKRKMKKFEAEHTGLIFDHTAGDSVSPAILLTLMRNDPDKLTFLTPPMEQFFTDLPRVTRDSVMQFMLHKGDQIIATTLAFRIPDSLLLYNSGFNPMYPGAGWYIKVKTIAWAIDQHIRSYNLLQGNERYKYDLGAKDFAVYKITLPL